MSNFKKISAVVMALTLVLCVGYFSMLSTTSAWFYDTKTIDSGDSFIFGDLSVDTSFNSKSKIKFDGATKLADPNEILFDEVVNVEEILVYNSGTVPARVYADVVVKGDAAGFSWFVFDETIETDGVKATIEASLPELSADALTAYNKGEDGNGGRYLLLQPGEISTMKIATWIEYDFVADALRKGEALEPYDVEISLIATQNVDGALQR